MKLKLKFKFYPLILAFLFGNLYANEYAVASFVKGKVNILSSSDSQKLWKALKVNDPIRPGDRIKTGNGSKVDFTFQESEFRLQPNTDFTLKEWDAKKKIANIHVESGASWFRVKGFQAGRFQVSNPTTTAGVRGTAFGVFYEEKEKKGYTCVCEGKVNINGTDFTKGTGGALAKGASDLEKNEYKDLITKEGSTILMKERIKSMPMLSRCLPCHKPIGWTSDGFLPDEKYGK